MTVPAWPAGLQQRLLASKYGEAVPDNRLITSMEVGPAKIRRRSTSAVRPVQGSIIVTAEELADFKEFYNDDLLGGSLRFTWVDPVDGTTEVEMRFTEPPAWAAITESSNDFEIDLKLEIMP